VALVAIVELPPISWNNHHLDISIIVYPDIFYIYYIIIVTINPLLTHILSPISFTQIIWMINHW